MNNQAEKLTDNNILTNMSIGKHAKTTYRWLLALFKFLCNRNRRFCLISPPLICNQTIYDRLTRKFLRVRIRDNVDFYVVNEIFCDNDYGFEKLKRQSDIDKYYQKVVSSNRAPLIVDCGANCGMATKYFATTFPQARIIAIEPEKGNLELAKVNSKEADIIFLLAGVGNSDARGKISDPKLGNWAYRMEDDVNGPTNIMSINTILSEEYCENSMPFIIKIDIEGFESNLFSKNTEWIDKFPVLIIELHDWMLPKTANSRNFLKEISKLDRDFIYAGENVFSISNTIFEDCDRRPR